MKILVTTPNGKVGREILKGLLEKGISVRAGVHNMAHASSLTGVEVVHFDFENEDSVKAALRAIDALYLASPSTTPAELEKRVVDLAKAAGVKRIVKLSAMGVETRDNPLRQVEQHIESSGLEWTFLRPSWFMQNFNTGQRDYIKGYGAIIEASGDGKTGFVDVRDIAAVGVKALTEDGHHAQGYALSGPEALDRNAVAAIISNATGKTILYQSLTDEEFRAQTAREQWPTAAAEQMSWLYGTVRAGYSATVTDTVKRVLGRDPIRFEQYAQDHKSEWV